MISPLLDLATSPVPTGVGCDDTTTDPADQTDLFAMMVMALQQAIPPQLMPADTPAASPGGNSQASLSALPGVSDSLSAAAAARASARALLTPEQATIPLRAPIATDARPADALRTAPLTLSAATDAPVPVPGSRVGSTDPGRTVLPLQPAPDRQTPRAATTLPSPMTGVPDQSVVAATPAFETLRVLLGEAAPSEDLRARQLGEQVPERSLLPIAPVAAPELSGDTGAAAGDAGGTIGLPAVASPTPSALPEDIPVVAAESPQALRPLHRQAPLVEQMPLQIRILPGSRQATRQEAHPTAAAAAPGTARPMPAVTLPAAPAADQQPAAEQIPPATAQLAAAPMAFAASPEPTLQHSLERPVTRVAAPAATATTAAQPLAATDNAPLPLSRGEAALPELVRATAQRLVRAIQQVVRRPAPLRRPAEVSPEAPVQTRAEVPLPSQPVRPASDSPVSSLLATAQPSGGAPEAQLPRSPAPAAVQAPASAEQPDLGEVRELRVELAPPDLGAVTVRLQHYGREVIASLLVDHEQARQVVQQSETQVRHSLSQEGLQMGAFDVACRDHGQGQQAPERRDDLPLPLQTRAEDPTPVSPMRQASHQPVKSLTAVDLYA